jgi:TPP-dependent pyruvate/acetoin dehydrogenase alpha subunit
VNPSETLQAVLEADRALNEAFREGAPPEAFREGAPPEAFREGAPAPFPLPIGELAPVVAGTISALGRSDWWLPSLRERVGAAARGVPLDRLSDGRVGARPYKVVPAGGSPALRALYAVGIAHAERASADRFVVVQLGIGSASDGALHEALNLAALLRPNVIFVISVHPLLPGAEPAPLGQQLAASPGALGRAFGLAVTEVDGTDADAVAAAVRAARAGTGPHVIEARLAGGET